MLRLVRTNLAESLEPVPGRKSEEKGQGARRFPNLHDDIFSLRELASSSIDTQTRLFAANALCDMDSFAFVLEHTGHSDSRDIAQKGLERRMDSFSDDVLRHLANSSESGHVRSCAEALLERRK